MVKPEQLSSPMPPMSVEYYGKRYQWFGSMSTKALAEQEASKVTKKYSKHDGEIKTLLKRDQNRGTWLIYIRFGG